MNYQNFNNPYVSKPDPNQLPISRMPKELSNSMAKTSMILAIIGLICVFTFTVYPAMVLGALSIIIALLSKGCKPKLHSQAKTGVALGITALCINLAITIGSFVLIFSDPDYYEQFNQMYEQINGERFDDVLDEIKNGTYDPYSNLN